MLHAPPAVAPTDASAQPLACPLALARLHASPDRHRRARAQGLPRLRYQLACVDTCVMNTPARLVHTLLPHHK